MITWNRLLVIWTAMSSLMLCQAVIVTVFSITAHHKAVRFGFILVTHLPLVLHICVTELGQHWFRYWLVTNSAPSHYLSQCWVLSIGPFATNFSEILIKIQNENTSENIIFDMVAIWSREKWVKLHACFLCIAGFYTRSEHMRDDVTWFLIGWNLGGQWIENVNVIWSSIVFRWCSFLIFVCMYISYVN